MLRCCVVLVGFAGLALLVVGLRSEQTRTAARVMACESDWMEARRSLWSLQARAARLKSPRQIHDRTNYLQAGVIPPDQQEPEAFPDQLVQSAKGPGHVGRAATP